MSTFFFGGRLSAAAPRLTGMPAVRTLATAEDGLRRYLWPYLPYDAALPRCDARSSTRAELELPLEPPEPSRTSRTSGNLCEPPAFRICTLSSPTTCRFRMSPKTCCWMS